MISDLHLLQEALQKYWGYSVFRPYQAEICLKILAKTDVCAIMATGSGKSLLYQLPSIALSEIGKKVTTLVVSPLLSLMVDQVAFLTQMGVRAGMLGSGDINSEKSALSGDYVLLYITPEKLMNWENGIMEMRTKTEIICVAIDESHCVSEWGHDFRPIYRQLGRIRDILRDVPIIALTATATKSVTKDIITNMKLKNPYVIQTSFNRENIEYYVKLRRNRSDDLELISLLRDFYKNCNSSGSRDNQKSLKQEDYNHSNKNIRPAAPPPRCAFPYSIIYVNNKSTTEQIARTLRNAFLSYQGLVIEHYHAGLSTKERMSIHRRFSTDEIHIIISTIAFGMGIHKSDIRLVVNYGLPSSIESYYQQSGRAGRDGLPAKSVLLYHSSDLQTALYFTAITNSPSVSPTGSSGTSTIQEKIRQQKFQTIRSFVQNDTACRRNQILEYFEDSDTLASLPQAPRHRCCDVCNLQLQHRSSVGRSEGKNDQSIQWMETGHSGPMAIFSESKSANTTSAGAPLFHQHQPSISHSSSTSSVPSSPSFNRNQCDPNTPPSTSSAGRAAVDLSQELKLLLEAVRSTGERYGILLPVSILMGCHDVNTQKVLGYSDLEVFGQGKGRHKKEWWVAFGKHVATTSGGGYLDRVITKIGGPVARGRGARGGYARGSTAGFRPFVFERYVLSSKGREVLCSARSVHEANTSTGSKGCGYAQAVGGKSKVEFDMSQVKADGNRVASSTAVPIWISPSLEMNQIEPPAIHHKINHLLAYSPTSSAASISASRSVSTSISIPDSGKSSERSVSRRRTDVTTDTTGTPSSHNSTSTCAENLSTEQQLQLDSELRRVRAEIASETNTAAYSVLSTVDLKSLINKLPRSTVELKGLPGWGVWKIKAFGERFIRAILYVVAGWEKADVTPDGYSRVLPSKLLQVSPSSSSVRFVNDMTNSDHLQEVAVMASECVVVKEEGRESWYLTPVTEPTPVDAVRDDRNNGVHISTDGGYTADIRNRMEEHDKIVDGQASNAEDSSAADEYFHDCTLSGVTALSDVIPDGRLIHTFSQSTNSVPKINYDHDRSSSGCNADICDTKLIPPEGLGWNCDTTASTHETAATPIPPKIASPEEYFVPLGKRCRAQLGKGLDMLGKLRRKHTAGSGGIRVMSCDSISTHPSAPSPSNTILSPIITDKEALQERPVTHSHHCKLLAKIENNNGKSCGSKEEVCGTPAWLSSSYNCDLTTAIVTVLQAYSGELKSGLAEGLTFRELMFHLGGYSADVPLHVLANECAEVHRALNVLASDCCVYLTSDGKYCVVSV